MAARSAHRPAAAAARPGPGRRPPGGAGRRRAGFEPALAGGRRHAPVGAEQLERVMPPVSRISFSSRARHERPATILGIALGVAFTVCFVTGLLSHAAQTPIPWFPWPAGPAWLYRLTQGVHVFTGLATIPLLLGKLWAVYPRLWRWPPVSGVAHAVERAATAPATPEGLDRRRFLLAIAAAAGAVVLTTVGSAVTPLRRLAVLAPRLPDIGPQGLPVNHQARDVGVTDVSGDPGYRLRVDGRVARPLELSLGEVRARRTREVRLPISCVEGWSYSARWRGIPLRDLLEEAGADRRAAVVVRSLQTRGPYSGARIDGAHAWHPDTLLALEVNGAPLQLDHGFPLRLIAPNNPGVLQTKWVTEVQVL